MTWEENSFPPGACNWENHFATETSELFTCPDLKSCRVFFCKWCPCQTPTLQLVFGIITNFYGQTQSEKKNKPCLLFTEQCPLGIFHLN